MTRRTLWLLLVGGVVSIGAFVFIQLYTNAGHALPSLEGPWSLVAGLPLLLALLIGGHIRRFKGFGIEFEASVSKPEDVHVLQANDVVPVDVLEKGGLAELDAMNDQERELYESLRFNAAEPAGYYEVPTTQKYIKNLPNLRFVEVRRADGTLRNLLRIDALKPPAPGATDVDDPAWIQKIQRFIQALERGSIRSDLSDYRVRKTINFGDSLISILAKLRRAGVDRDVTNVQLHIN